MNIWAKFVSARTGYNVMAKRGLIPMFIMVAVLGFAGTIAANAGVTAAYDLHWQALAKKRDCALLGSSYFVLNEATDDTPGGAELWFDARRGSDKTFLKALDDFAAKSGHPELRTVPWCIWGHSGGGIWADLMTDLYPERVVAVWLRSGCAAMFRVRKRFPQPDVPQAAYSVPIMCNPGIKEKGNIIWTGSLAIFSEYRAHSAPIGFAPDPLTGHGCGECRYCAIPFFDACLAMRLPDKGSNEQKLKPVDMSKAWLAPLNGDKAVPASSYEGKVEQAVWLPNEQFAKVWMEYVKTGFTSDTTPPPAPTHVKAVHQDAGTIQITWRAEADFESGIGGFIIVRDGKELARLPEKPIRRFARSLFQAGFTNYYHDTPGYPVPVMCYEDNTIKRGVKYKYAVIAVNSVGLKSEPADPIVRGD